MKYHQLLLSAITVAFSATLTTAQSSSSSSASKTSSSVSSTTVPSGTVAAAAYTPTTHVLNWKIGYVNVNPDGNRTRVAIGINDKFPPDEVIVYAGDTLEIHMDNQLSEPTSLHFHGLFQNGTNQYDGVSGVTQCPTPPGQKFTYKIPLLPTQYGSYWIHGHNLGHYVDGLRTPLVIKNPNEDRKYDEDLIMRVTDWYHDSHKDLMAKFMSLYNPMGFEPTPDSALINEARDSTYKFTPGKTYRLRIISQSAIGLFQVYMDNHNFTVIEVDGVDVEPYQTSSVVVAPAQRFSVLITALDGADAKQNYYLHADMNTDMFDGLPSGDTNPTALVMYGDNTLPVFESMGAPEDILDETQLAPIEKIAALKPTQQVYLGIAALKPTQQVYLGVSFQIMSDGSNHGTFNNIVYTRPNVPTLFTALTVGDEYVENPAVYGTNTNPYVLGHMNVIEVVIDNFDGGSHPFHLHGHVFQIVELNEDHAYDPTNVTENPFPVRRDTVTIPGGGYVIIRFVADNPGVWLLHCHIEWHFEAGLVTTFVEAPKQIKNSSWPDVVFFEQCGMQGIPVTGNAAGNQGFDMKNYVGGPGMLVWGQTKVFWESVFGCAVASVIGVVSVVWYAWPGKSKEVPTVAK
ncbi:ferroxidase fet3 [Blyttiomyces sp. JEL0837]|nr:ferroxidase fet3 [Blyttiomyces sp. JEL0837]